MRFPLSSVIPTLSLSSLKPLVRYFYSQDLEASLKSIDPLGHAPLLPLLAVCRVLELSPDVGSRIESRLLAHLSPSNAAEILQVLTPSFQFESHPQRPRDPSSSPSRSFLQTIVLTCSRLSHYPPDVSSHTLPLLLAGIHGLALPCRR